MVTRNPRRRRGILPLLVCLFMTFMLLQIIVGCGTVAQNTTPTVQLTTPATATPSGSTAVATQVSPTPTPPPASTPAVPGLQGPTNFVFKTPLDFISINGTTTDDGGTPTAIGNATLKAGVTSEFEHALFVVDGNNNISLYRPATNAPIKTTITRRTDGSVEIAYTESLNQNSGLTSISFDGVLINNQIMVAYQQDYSPAITSGGVVSDIATTFMANIQWVSASEIPRAPDNGQFQFVGANGVALAWGAAQNAVSYNVYRLIPGQDQQFQLVATVKTPAYTDVTPTAWQAAHTTTGVTYGIFSVGPTGVENPDGIPIVTKTS